MRLRIARPLAISKEGWKISKSYDVQESKAETTGSERSWIVSDENIEPGGDVEAHIAPEAPEAPEQPDVEGHAFEAPEAPEAPE